MGRFFLPLTLHLLLPNPVLFLLPALSPRCSAFKRQDQDGYGHYWAEAPPSTEQGLCGINMCSPKGLPPAPRSRPPLPSLPPPWPGAHSFWHLSSHPLHQQELVSASPNVRDTTMVKGGGSGVPQFLAVRSWARHFLSPTQEPGCKNTGMLETENISFVCGQKDFLSTYCMPGSVLCSGQTALGPALLELRVQRETHPWNHQQDQTGKQGESALEERCRVREWLLGWGRGATLDQVV